MKKYKYGDPKASDLLIQMVDDHDLAVIENEISLIRKMTENDFFLIAFKVNDWNNDLSPWPAPAVFGNKGFGDGAEGTLSEILDEIKGFDNTCYIGGYSLAGLFALWVAYQTDRFSGVAAASPSIWFPGFVDHMKASQIKTGKVYLSLGDRESRTGNPFMASVKDCIEAASDHLKSRDISCVLEWNKGNHFKEPDLRTAKAFAWVLNN
ncbi:MAG: esterase [Lachnospiraceae bacterium]|nr:esterase [Lachnospiraceae bacterium]